MAQIYAPPPLRVTHASPEPPTPSPPAATTPSPSRTQADQARRLQLRQRRFPALIIPTPPVRQGEGDNNGSGGDGSRRSSGELGILREISNGSLRRRGPGGRKSRDSIAADEESQQEEENAERRGKPPRGQQQGRYIEHLEAQLSRAQAERQQTGRLRAEARAARREVVEWEGRFESRVREQTEQYEVAVGSLRAQVRAMRREAEVGRERVEELEREAEERGRMLAALEETNFELERRLQMMGELLATSPGKVGLRAAQSRRESWAAGGKRNSLFSPRNSMQMFRWPPEQAERSPVSPGWHVSQSSIDSTVFESANSASSMAGDVESATSESTLLNSPRGVQSPWICSAGPLEADGDVRRRPVRRMRRFQSGANGPRSLILPAATYGAASAPVTTVNTPAIPADPQEPVSAGVEETVIPKHPGTLHRSTTWAGNATLNDDDPPEEPSATAPTTFHTPLTSRNFPPASGGRTFSAGAVSGHNLFEELSRLKEEEEEEHNDDDNDDNEQHLSRPSTAKPRPARSSSSATLDNLPPSQPAYIPITNTTSLLHNLLALATRTLAHPSTSARRILRTAWTRVTLSPPALEFRFWLIRILLGDLQRKRRRRRAPAPRRRRKSGGEEGSESDISDDEAYRPFNLDLPALGQGGRRGVMRGTTGGVAPVVGLPVLPPVQWLRFSLGLVFAVGLAIRDGPGALLVDGAGEGGGEGEEEGDVEK